MLNFCMQLRCDPSATATNRPCLFEILFSLTASNQSAARQQKHDESYVKAERKIYKTQNAEHLET